MIVVLSGGAPVAWCNGLRARIESVTDYYCNTESLYTEEVTKDRTGNETYSNTIITLVTSPSLERTCPVV